MDQENINENESNNNINAENIEPPEISNLLKYVKYRDVHVGDFRACAKMFQDYQKSNDNNKGASQDLQLKKNT